MEDGEFEDSMKPMLFVNGISTILMRKCNE